MIIVLFGQPHSGKSTLARQLDGHNIDGDKLRDLFTNKDYSKEGRIKNLNRASDIAKYVDSHFGDVILSLVYPYKEAREYLNSIADNVVWVYLTYEGERGRENFHVNDFETPAEDEALYLDTSKMSEEECLTKIKEYVKR